MRAFLIGAVVALLTIGAFFLGAGSQTQGSRIEGSSSLLQWFDDTLGEGADDLERSVEDTLD